jgi:hypothetical protein
VSSPPSLLGPLVSRLAVEQAVISTLQNPPVPNGNWPLLTYFLAETERQYGLAAQTLTPPGPESIRGGMDFETFREDQFPLVIVVAEPYGEPERPDPVTYTQVFDVQIAATVQAQIEDDTRAYADAYGIAVAGALLKFGGLGGLASRTWLAGFPRLEFPDLDMRTIIRSVSTFRTVVDAVLTEGGGPTIPWPSDPYSAPGSWATVAKVTVALQSEDTLGNLTAPNGTTVTDSHGTVVVTE